MKFQARRDELPIDEFGTTNEGEPLWISLPGGVPAGFAMEFGEAPVIDESLPEEQKKALRLEATKASNWKILSLARGWNFDDDEGASLPLPRDVTEEKFEDDAFDPDRTEKRLTAHDKFVIERDRILAAVPLPIFEFIANRTVNRKRAQ